MQQELGRTTPYSPSSPLSARAATHVPAANLTYAYAGFGAVLGVLFGVATAVTLHQSNQIVALQKPAATTAAPAAAHETGVVFASFAGPEEKDMGSVSSPSSGLRGHLTTSWSEKLGYRFVVEPAEAAQRPAFAQAVSDPPRPLSIEIQLKAASGQVLCNQRVVVKYDPRKAVAQDANDLDRLEAQEFTRERNNDIFQSDLGKDGQIRSISSQGTMPCTKQAYDSAAFWSFSPQFPDLREQARLMKPAAPAPQVAAVKVPEAHPVFKAAPVHTAIAVVKAPAVPAHTSTVKVAVAKALPAPNPRAAAEGTLAAKAVEQTAEVQKMQPFHFQIEGDDEIVDFDAAQKSLETSAGKTFFVSETLVASNVAGWLDEQANVHYRCDETSNCTLSLASAATVLHATMRPHRSSAIQQELVSMSDGPSSGPQDFNPIPVSPNGMGH